MEGSHSSFSGSLGLPGLDFSRKSGVVIKWHMWNLGLGQFPSVSLCFPGSCWITGIGGSYEMSQAVLLLIVRE